MAQGVDELLTTLSRDQPVANGLLPEKGTILVVQKLLTPSDQVFKISAEDMALPDDFAQRHPYIAGESRMIASES